MATSHLPHPHMPHLHVPHAHVDEHPWRAFPIAIGTIFVIAAIFIVVCFAIAKAVTGHAY
jgi:hypothetical protein